MFKKLLFSAVIFYLPLQIKLPNMPVFPIINILTVLLVGYFISSKRPQFQRPNFEIALIFFMMAWFFSFIYACMFTDGMPRIEIMREFKRVFLLPLLYFIFSRCMTSEKEVRFYFKVFLLCLMFVGWNTWFNGVLGGSNFGDHKRSSGPFGYGWGASDIAGGFIAIFTPFLLSYFFFTKNVFSKTFSGIGVGVCGLGLMATYSRGSMMAFLFAAIFMLLFSLGKLAKGSKINFLIILVGLSLGLVFWKMWVPESIITRVEGTFVSTEEGEDPDYTMNDEEGNSNLDDSSQLRINAWQTGLDFFLQHPFTGIGAHQVKFQLGYDPHNSFILVAGEMGVLGIIFFFWLILSIFFTSVRLINTDFTALTSGFVGCMVGFIIVNCFYSNFFRDTVSGSFWILLGLLAAYRNILLQPADNSSSDNSTKVTYSEYRKKYLK